MDTTRRRDVTHCCWSSVPPALTASWAAGDGTRLAVLAAPVDFDECFAAAGYTEFADSGDDRYDELSDMTASLIARLRRFGAPSQRLGQAPVWAGSSIVHWLRAMLGRPVPTPTLTDMVVCPMTDDQFGTCVIDFGVGPAASLCTSGGHDIWWLYLAPGVSDRGPELIDALAGGRSVRHVELDLTPLAPLIQPRA